MFLAVDLRPERFSGRATKGIAVFGQSGETHLAPALAVRPRLPENPSRQIIPVPACLDDDEQTSETDTRRGRRLPPVPLLLAVGAAAGFFVVLDRVVHDRQVRAAAGDRTTDASRGH